MLVVRAYNGELCWSRLDEKLEDYACVWGSSFFSSISASHQPVTAALTGLGDMSSINPRR